MVKSNMKYQGLGITITGILTTITVNPWFGFDPINLPKMFVLTCGASVLFTWFIVNFSQFVRPYRKLLLMSALFCFSIIVSFFTNSAIWSQQLWGVWGRSTGLLTYLSFVSLLVVAAVIANSEILFQVRHSFERLGYFISVYTFLQLMDLDPINWTQKALIATLGNINFMSSFLGMVSISYTCRLVMDKIALSQRIFYLVVLFCNFTLIWVSQSIQGIGVYLAGVSLIMTFKLRNSIKYLHALFFLAGSAFVGTLIFLGTAGIGPLLRFKQETVSFRVDYWLAGLEMIRANIIDGVGLDSYGDYYREFRSIEAVTKTGPARVSNTAHNIFIDVSAGAGVIAGLLFLVIMIYTLKLILEALRLQIRNNDFIAFSGIWMGFMVFCMISINQIGVGVWGFIVTGLICGFVIRLREKDHSSRQDAIKRKSGEMVNRTQLDSLTNSPNERIFFKFWLVAFGSIFVIAATVIALIPNVADYRFLKVYKTSNLGAMANLMHVPGIQDFHRERFISSLLKAGQDEEAINQALALVEDNPRNWYGWVTLISTQGAPIDIRTMAGEQLIKLDPNNQGLKTDVAEFLKN